MAESLSAIAVCSSLFDPRTRSVPGVLMYGFPNSFCMTTCRVPLLVSLSISRMSLSGPPSCCQLFMLPRYIFFSWVWVIVVIPAS